MNSDFAPELRRELMDDFYAECDELLGGLRDGLLRLEHSGRSGEAEQGVLRDLFRGMHSLKGISAIVGLGQAEQLAHGAEDLLRALSKEGLAATTERVDLLLDAAQRLEEIIAAHRQARALPGIDDLLEKLRRFGLAPKAAAVPVAAPVGPASEKPADPLAEARGRGLRLYRISFVPSPALEQRGINLNSVRARLTALGEIVAVKPVVKKKGSVTFEFTFGLPTAAGELPPSAFEDVEVEPLVVAAEAASAIEAPAAEALSLTPSHLVRVDLTRLDDLMRITGEMMIQRFRLEERLTHGGADEAGLRELTTAFGRSLREMRQAIGRVRMVPIAEIFARIPFVVRDLARDSGQKVRVRLEGNQTEVDKYLVERLKEPLLHVVRNALAHGIETPAARVAAGKRAEATLTLRARSEGESVVIEVEDDGRGIDAEAIFARAASLGLGEGSAGAGDTNRLLTILCTSGFSSRDEVDRAAGRGVGMAVVASAVRELGGVLNLKTQVGAGTRFTLKLPLTLSIADAVLVEVNGQTWAVPQNAVNEIVQISAEAVRTVGQAEVASYRTGLLPIVRLRALFGAGKGATGALTVLVVNSERGPVGLVVDRVKGQREIVIRPLTDPCLQVPGISGATELGDGRPILILDPIALALSGVHSASVREDRALATASS